MPAEHRTAAKNPGRPLFAAPSEETGNFIVFGLDHLQLEGRGAGGGLSFVITESYEVHFLGRYQPVSMHGLSDYSMGLDFGMNFYF